MSPKIQCNLAEISSIQKLVDLRGTHSESQSKMQILWKNNQQSLRRFEKKLEIGKKKIMQTFFRENHTKIPFFK